MKAKALIHISDLHIAELNEPGIGVKNERIEKTWLKAQEDKDNDDYIGVFCRSVKEQISMDDHDYYLLVSGDIADSSSEAEYIYAEKFLEQIHNELKIDKKKILIVPGNHDIYRPKCREAADKNPKTPAHLNFGAKYDNFKCFFDRFYKGTKKTFEVNKQIVDSLALDEEKILFVGINTNYKIHYKGGTGAVEIDAFKKELTELCEQFSDYIRIAVFHHNIKSDSEEDNSFYGSWEKTDWIRFKNVLEEKDFKMVVFGNEHTRASTRQLNTHRGENVMYMSDSGSFALHTDTCTPSYKVYVLVHDETKTTLIQHIFELHDRGQEGVYEYGRWCRLVNKDHDELDEFVLRERKPNPFEQKIKEEISTETGRSISGIDGESQKTSEGKTNNNLEPLDEKGFRKKMMTIIKSEHLYHPGHFHWGKSSRSHNWIDTVSLLNDRTYIRLIQGQIRKQIREIEECQQVKFDAIIGIGMEGNIMSTQLLLEDIPYTYLPYTDRYEEFNAFEKNVCLNNSDGRYKNVLIIADVVNRGRMLKRLVEEKSAAFFSKVEQIHIVSLFYTGDYGDKEMPIGLKDIKDKTIKFYSLMQLEVGKCPYDDDFENTCTIFKEHLCEVYEFYSEK